MEILIAKFKLTVDYDQSLKMMIKAGKYDWLHPDVTKKHFPIEDTGKKEMELKLFRFGCRLSSEDIIVGINKSEDIITEINRAGFRPAKSPELLKFGEKYPGLQKQSPIIALGQLVIFHGKFRYVLGLGSLTDKRGLYLYRYDDNWSSKELFLGIRKQCP